MGIKAKFSKDDVRKLLEKQYVNIEKAIINRLIYIGEAFVRNARTKTKEQGGFGDITGNLRSSIGYSVFNNGKVVKQNFLKSPRGTDGEKGIAEAKLLIEQLSADYPTGYVLIVVAGMDYAAAVESRGRDVLTASSITAKNDLKRALESLKNNIRNQ